MLNSLRVLTARALVRLAIFAAPQEYAAELRQFVVARAGGPGGPVGPV